MKSELKPSVRINLEAKKKLESIQQKTNRSQTALLDRAVELLALEILGQQMQEDLADLCVNEKALAEYNALSTAFDQGAPDGLGGK